ncbi:MAG: hypothetical protein HC936_16640 [Leptolyngbyaceae cyanobacterium SU_3_3]|nr:hypothetical protein [Leptolyngbyaceae cyanobacterium SU_3_3]
MSPFRKLWHPQSVRYAPLNPIPPHRSPPGCFPTHRSPFATALTINHLDGFALTDKMQPLPQPTIAWILSGEQITLKDECKDSMRSQLTSSASADGDAWQA